MPTARTVGVYLMGLLVGMLIPACWHLCGVVPYEQIPPTSAELPAYFLEAYDLTRATVDISPDRVTVVFTIGTEQAVGLYARVPAE